MNKKIIFIGTIIGVLACLFPPFGQYINGNFMMFDGWHFITFTRIDPNKTYDLATFTATMITMPYFVTEIVGIIMATFGLAYTIKTSSKEK